MYREIRGMLRSDVNVGENAPSERQPMATEATPMMAFCPSMRSKVCFHATTLNSYYILSVSVYVSMRYLYFLMISE